MNARWLGALLVVATVPLAAQTNRRAVVTVGAGLVQAAASRAPDAVPGADELSFDGSLARSLAGLPTETQVRITGWPVAPAVRKDVIVTLHDVYAGSAQIYRVEGTSSTAIPRSQLKFFWGAAEDDATVQVLVVIDPGANAVSGFSDSLDGSHELLPPARPGAAQILARSDALVPKGMALTSDCAQGSLPARPARAARSAGSEPAAAISTLHTATIAIDTDNELMQQKFSDDTTSATNYLATLIATMNIMYERDLLVRLVQGQTFLRVSSTPDPYSANSGGAANSTELNEFGNYWIANNAAIPRALAMMLSGKSTSPNSSSGIAWIDALCEKGNAPFPVGGYSFSKVFKFPGSTGASDAKLVGHELGHNFGSPHTHCPLPGDSGPTIDACYNGEAANGCYAGATTCPAKTNYQGVPDVEGTVMSYCHLKTGCTATSVFHPRTIQYLNNLVQNAATPPSGCIVPLATTRTVCASGCTHTKLQDAINAATPNDTILVKPTYDATTAGEVFPVNTTAIGSAGAITILGETDSSGAPASTVKVKGPGTGLIVVSPGSVLKNLKFIPGDATNINRVITAARSGGTCPGPTCHLNGLTIQNVVIDFTSTFNTGNGLDLLADNVLIDKVTIKGIDGNSIFVDGNNYTIQNSTLDGRDPNAGNAIRGMQAIRFGADQKQPGGVECSGFPTNYVIQNNTITGYATGIQWCTGRSNTVQNNTLTDISGNGIVTAGSQGTQVLSNVLQNNTVAGFLGIGFGSLSFPHNVYQVCSGNKAALNKVLGRAARDMRSGIRSVSCRDTQIIQNEVRNFADFSGSIYVAVEEGQSTQTVIQGNTVIGGNGEGIVYFGADPYGTSADRSVIRDNVVNDQARNGIVVQHMKGPRSGAGAGNVVAYNTVRAVNQGNFINTHAFNLQNLANTAFDRNTALDTRGVAGSTGTGSSWRTPWE
jgi:hypothetical protein